MSDIATIVWKEWKDALFQGGWRSWARPVLLIGILGVFEPLVGKRAWMSLGAIEMVVFLWFAFFIIISVVADSFAGERERHTLETLLASRIPDRAILIGKVTIVTLYGWGVMVIGLFLGALVYNLAHGDGGFTFYPIDMTLFTLGLGLLVGLLGASGGAMISLRIATVRQAQQTLTVGTLILGAAIFGLAQLLPKEFFTSFTGDQILLMAGGVVILLDVAVLAYGIARFQRAKLILS